MLENEDDIFNIGDLILYQSGTKGVYCLPGSKNNNEQYPLEDSANPSSTAHTSSCHQAKQNPPHQLFLL